MGEKGEGTGCKGEGRGGKGEEVGNSYHPVHPLNNVCSTGSY